MDGNDFIDQMAKEPTLDELMRKQPPLTDAELRRIVELQREQRALFITKKGT